MAGEKINEQYITQYLHTLFVQKDELLKEMEEYAKINDVPIIHPEVRALLETICAIKKPTRILEVGTAIGYSGLVLSKCLPQNGRLITIERDSSMVELALKNIKKADAEDKIRVIEGEALEVLNCLDSKFDLIFIDAAKGYYHEFLELVMPLIKKGSIIISDNVLYKGMTANDELVPRRQKTIVGRMREYLSKLCNCKEFTTSVIPVGDGVAISYYNGGNFKW